MELPKSVPGGAKRTFVADQFIPGDRFRWTATYAISRHGALVLSSLRYYDGTREWVRYFVVLEWVSASLEIQLHFPLEPPTRRTRIDIWE